MRAKRWMTGFLAAVVVVASAPLVTRAVSLRKECKLSCGGTIDACVTDGGRRRKCKRQTLKRCRQEGLAVCTPSTTTTTSSGGSTTTLAAGGTTTTLAGGSTTTTTTTPPGGTTTTTLVSVHGCSLANAVDRRGGGADRSVAFDFTFYDPKCMRISPGQSVAFNGDFFSHPLVGGEIVGSNEVPDPSSPIGVTSSGTSKSVPFAAAGTFPYFCANHGPPPSNMVGAVFVDP